MSDSSQRTRNTAILLAGGSGNRMQGIVEDKILAPIGGQPTIAHSIRAFEASGVIDHFVVVYRDDKQKDAIEPLFKDSTVTTIWTQGGTQRQDSVWAGLKSVPEDTRFVLIHDCARPCITPMAIRQSVEKAPLSGVSCLARPVTDTIKKVAPKGDGFTLETLDRSKLWAMETPQTFCFGLIHSGYTKAIAKGFAMTDDLSAIEDQNIPVTFIDNGRPNPKLTTSQDFALVEQILTNT